MVGDRLSLTFIKKYSLFMFNLNIKKQGNDFELDIKAGVNNSNSSFWTRLNNFLLSFGTAYAIFKYIVLPLFLV